MFLPVEPLLYLGAHSNKRERGIEPPFIAWKAIVLPLNYSRDLVNPQYLPREYPAINFPRKKWWAGEDSDL